MKTPEEVLGEIGQRSYDIWDENLVVDPIKLATFLAELSERVEKLEEHNQK